MIQNQNSFTQTINRVEAKISQFFNIYRNEKLYLTHYWQFPIFLVILIGAKNYDVLETLTKIQFHYTNLKLTNPKTWTNWKVFTSRKLNLIANVTSFHNFVIQFQFLNLCWLRYPYPIWTQFPNQYWFLCLKI